MSPRYSLEATAFAGWGAEGETVLIDNSRTRIEILDEDKVLKQSVRGERQDRFFYAYRAVTGADGSLYVADRAYEKDGKKAVLDRVIRICRGRTEVIWEKDRFAENNEIEKRYSIYELQIFEGRVYFLCKESKSLDLYSYDPAVGSEAVLERRIATEDPVNEASMDLQTGVLASTSRRGEVCLYRTGEETWEKLSFDSEHLMPRNISIRDHRVFFSDEYENRIYSFRENDTDAGLLLVYDGTARIRSIAADQEGDSILVSDGNMYYSISPEGIEYVKEISYQYFWVTLILWILLGVAVIIGVYFLFHLGMYFKVLSRNETFTRSTLVVLASVLVAFIVSFSLLKDLYENEEQRLQNTMQVYAECLIQQITPEDVSRLQWEKDYGSEPFKKVQGRLENMLSGMNSPGETYSFNLYRMEGDTVRYIMNSKDEVTCGQPCRSSLGQVVREAFLSGNSQVMVRRNADSYKDYVMIPLKDSRGDVCAVLQMGSDRGVRMAERRTKMAETILSVICTSAVVVMLIVELIFWIGFRDKRHTMPLAQKEDKALKLPLRTFMFLIYGANCMQEAFVAVLSKQLYQGKPALPPTTAAALPMSAELFMMALSALVFGQRLNRIGSRKALSLGMLLQLVGYALCPALDSYEGLLLGKVLVGSGMGIVYVTCNALAGSGNTTESVGKGFSDITVGTISGITVGGGMASLLLAVGSWEEVYVVGAVIAALGLALGLGSQNIIPEKRKVTAIDRQDMTTRRFLFNRRIPLFFLLILVPFMTTPSYRVYFFPLYAHENGLSDVRIGQIYLFCGLAILYIGPRLSAWVLKKLGAYYGMLVGTALTCSAIALFGFIPGLDSVVLGVALNYLFLTFAPVCMYTYFQETPECLGYGMGKSMGFFSIFESIGATIGPMIFGFLLMFGYRRGITIYTLAVVAALLVFWMFTGKAAKHFR